MTKSRKPFFLAIGVGQGDAYFLEKGTATVLVDGGRSTDGFPVQFRRVTKRNGVDILVCTHNDADHACGVLGFLRSGLECEEVWLPGIWTDRLEDVLLDPVGFVIEVVYNIGEAEMTPGTRLSLEDFGDRLHEKTTRGENEVDCKDMTTADAISRSLEDASSIEVSKELRWLWVLRWPAYWIHEFDLSWHENFTEARKFHLFIEAISAASRIRDISLAAYHSGALIRWFESGNNSANAEGNSQTLVPLNAREIMRIPRRRWTALEYLSLSTTNKRSLVFLSPEDKSTPAVLFSGDSDLSFPQHIPWRKGMIITAPHHGSEANARAYQRFENETNGEFSVVWIRSDGRFRTRPGKSYLRARGSRFCTLCRDSNLPKQNVRLESTSGKWKPAFTRRCCCA